MKKYFIVPGAFANAYDLVWTTDAGYYPDAEDYKRNAEDIEQQITRLKSKLKSCGAQEGFNIRHDIDVLESMRLEQLEVYYSLRDYYKK